MLCAHHAVRRLVSSRRKLALEARYISPVDPVTRSTIYSYESCVTGPRTWQRYKYKKITVQAVRWTLCPATLLLVIVAFPSILSLPVN